MTPIAVAARWRAFAFAIAALLASASLAAKPAQVIDQQRVAAITRTLASDEFEGRAPGTAGETKTVAYLVEQFKAAGLEPAGPAGSYTQVVPLVRTQVPADADMSVTVAGKRMQLKQQEQMAALTLRPVDRVLIERAPLVFVGYGVSAPERGWDDFKGVDLRGKVAVFLVNDPDYEAAPGEDAYGKFGGKAATYYARWTYKYDEAARRGAIGALIVHETGPAAYGWVTAIAPNGEGYDIVRADAAKEKLLLQSWLQQDAAIALLHAAGLDFKQLKQDARRKSFMPVELKDAFFTADYPLAHSRIDSLNVLGKITGHRHPQESIMIGAHWDAYGAGALDANGLRFRSGALDDAIGVAGTIEIARAFKQGKQPDRTLVFAAWTAEERGLLGSEYYATQPTLPLETTVANLTMDVLQPNGLARDVVLVGAGQNELETLLARKAAKQGRVVTPDAKPERGLAFRADHFPFAKRGVPTLLLMGMGGGHDLVNGGRAAGDRWVAHYTANCYHQACDRWDDSWDLSGAVQDMTLIYEIAETLATSRVWPNWNEGTEFRAVRAGSHAARK